jgi:regulatory protein
MSKKPERSIRWHAMRYLKSRTTSTGHLRTLLLRGAKKRFPDTPTAELTAAADRVLASLVEQGAMNDAAWARSRAAVLRRRGNSARQIRAKLRQKRLPADLIDAVLREQDSGAELVAALDYLRKRRLGPWKHQSMRREPPDPQKTLQKLGRRGFSYDVARRALEMDLEEAQERTGR